MMFSTEQIDYLNKHFDERYNDKFVPMDYCTKQQKNMASKFANDELKHADYIHGFAMTDISAFEKVYTAPVEMLDKWNHAHKEYVEKVAWIKQMLAM